MGIFSTKTKIYVSGGISRIREDKDIINTTGLVVSNASINNLDIVDEIRLNELTGTKASYKSLWRKAKSSIGLPEGLISYYSPDKEILATHIRNDTGNVYPVANDITSISSSQIVEDLFVKYELQLAKDYNNTTNTFIHSGNTYTLDSYTVDPGIKYIINGSRVIATPPFIENISIDLMVVLPPLTESVPDPEGYYVYIDVPVMYWHILYEYSGREYIWIAKANEALADMGDETDVPSALTEYFESFAPVIPTRNDFIDYTGDSADPLIVAKYKESKKLLKIIGLDIDDLNKAVNTGEGGGTNPEIDNIADTYVTMQSKLASEYMDELAYNYVFFDKLADIDTGFTLPPVIGIDGEISEAGRSANILTVIFSEIFNQRIYWNKTTKTIETGTLTSDYEYELANTGTNTFTDYSIGTYTIKKRLTSSTYEQIFVEGLAIQYYVYYDSDTGKAYSPEFTNTDPDVLNQLTIPVSLVIAKEALGNNLETFFLRTTYIGIFSRVIVKIKWYQQAWFKFVLIVIIIITLILAGPEIALAIESMVQSIGLVIGITTTTYVLAVLILALKAAIISYALKRVLTKVLESTDNQFLQALAIVAFVYVSYQMIDTSQFSTLESVNTVLGSVNTALSVKAEVAQEELEDIAEEVQLVTKTYEETLKEFKLTDNDKASELKSRYIAYLNLMSRSGVVYDEIETDLAVQSYDATVSYASTFVRSALNIDRESFAALFTSTEQLVDNEPTDPIVT
jgi:hypothetical protein